jgi:hypothetical protein
MGDREKFVNRFVLSELEHIGSVGAVLSRTTSSLRKGNLNHTGTAFANVKTLFDGDWETVFNSEQQNL